MPKARMRKSGVTITATGAGSVTSLTIGGPASFVNISGVGGVGGMAARGGGPPYRTRMLKAKNPLLNDEPPEDLIREFLRAGDIMPGKNRGAVGWLFLEEYDGWKRILYWDRPHPDVVAFRFRWPQLRAGEKTPLTMIQVLAEKELWVIR